MQKLESKARIKLPESFKEPGAVEHVLFSGKGVNLKTGKEISFKVPDTISKQGLENIVKNIKMRNFYHNYLVSELQELFE
jgi:hypothetical protein